VTADEYRETCDEFRRLVGDGSLNTVLRTAALACQEARAALMRAGKGDPALDRLLHDVQHRLEQEAHE